MQRERLQTGMFAKPGLPGDWRPSRLRRLARRADILARDTVSPNGVEAWKGDVIGNATDPAAERCMEGLQSGHRMTRILLVEDHEEIWDFLSRRLKRRGYDVVVATDGQQGVNKARTERPDVVLLDMNLPILDGWTAAGLIKSSTEAGRVPIIALTAHAMSGDKEKALSAGCDDYHPKPIDFAKLLIQIQALLGSAAA